MKKRVPISILGCGSSAALLLLTGCASETLFQSNFDATAIGQPPAHVQRVGTAAVDARPGNVQVIAPPVTPSGKWVEIRRPPNDPGQSSAFQGNLSQFRGDGTYTFTVTLFIPSGSGIATIQAETFGQAVTNYKGFLHFDFTEDNRVRIDDRPETIFGSFPRDQPFIVQITLNVTAPSPTASIVLSGAGASGQTTNYAILPPFRADALQFGAVRIWMGGIRGSGRFDATNIVVTRATQ